MHTAHRGKRVLSTARSIAVAAIVALMSGGAALAQKSGGTLVQITQPEPPNLAPYISTAGPIGQPRQARGQCRHAEEIEHHARHG